MHQLFLRETDFQDEVEVQDIESHQDAKVTPQRRWTNNAIKFSWHSNSYNLLSILVLRKDFDI